MSSNFFGTAGLFVGFVWDIRIATDNQLCLDACRRVGVLFMAVHLAVSLLLDLLHVPARKRGGAKGDCGQEGDRLPPFF